MRFKKRKDAEAAKILGNAAAKGRALRGDYPVEHTEMQIFFSFEIIARVL